jgi:hypothetical protein
VLGTLIYLFRFSASPPALASLNFGDPGLGSAWWTKALDFSGLLSSQLGQHGKKSIGTQILSLDWVMLETEE